MVHLWVQGAWPDNWKIINIAVLELYPIVLLMQMFGQKLTNSSLLFHCEFVISIMAIVECINRQTSKNQQIMKLLRRLVLILLKFNIRFCSQHIASVENTIADAISRFQETHKLLNGSGLAPSITVIPEKMLLELQVVATHVFRYSTQTSYYKKLSASLGDFVHFVSKILLLPFILPQDTHVFMFLSYLFTKVSYSTILNYV